MNYSGIKSIDEGLCSLAAAILMKSTILAVFDFLLRNSALTAVAR
ncbi:hypothetical protein [Nostoc sp.]